MSDTFFILVFLHLIGVVVGFGAVLVIDTFGLLWILKLKGVDLKLVTKVAETTQKLIWLGYTALILTGVPLLVMKGSVGYLTRVKIFLVLMLGLNGIFLHFIKKGLERLNAGENVPAVYMFRIGLASAISQTGWWGALLIGFLNRQVKPNLPWAHNYLWIIGGVASIFLVVWIVGEVRLKKTT